VFDVYICRGDVDFHGVQQGALALKMAPSLVGTLLSDLLLGSFNKQLGLVWLLKFAEIVGRSIRSSVVVEG
jgi:hypothetical protein